MSRIIGLFAHLGSSATARLVLALIVVLSVFAYVQAPAVAQQGGLDPAPDPRVAGIETDFLVSMIPHHRGRS